ncbi:BPI fold-containing family A member 1 [Pteronotus mesoamericanus]|uniref:BPI fold-containing family A member 1 n=1 Tax=Pteronotus mesoamericanus TaxID=1884717 RepID=UPI0023EC266B|nr:BPI fold-containing family A member 1 [Pteronotus parnellii mesoamericanus]
MFKIGGLIVFCGLLALPLPVDLASDPTDLAKGFTDAVKNNLLSGDLLNGLKNIPLLGALKNLGNGPDGIVSGLLQQVISLLNPLKNILDINIASSKLLELGLVQSEDGHRLYLTIPLDLDVAVQVPLIKKRLLNLSVKLNTTVELAPVKDENGTVHLVLGDCTQPPGKLDITVLDGADTFFLQTFANTITNILNKGIPLVVQGPVCTIVNELLSRLDVSLVQEIANKLLTGEGIVINI